MIKKQSMMLSIFLIALLFFWGTHLSHLEPEWKTFEKVTYLSYIPPLDIYGQIEPFYEISLEKIHVFEESSMDDLAKLEQLTPVIDKVLYIPDGFHEYVSLNHQNRTGKIG